MDENAITPIWENGFEEEGVDGKQRPRVLVPVLDTAEAQRLLPLAAAIAAEKGGEVLVLSIVELADDQPLGAAVGSARTSRLALAHAFDGHNDLGVPVRSTVRVDYDHDHAIRGAVADLGVDLVLIGWDEAQSSTERLFGHPVDLLLREPPCDVVIVKLDRLEGCEHILLPVRGGPNTRLASEVARALARYAGAAVTVLYAHDPRQPDNEAARASIETLRKMPHASAWVERHGPVQQAIVNEAARHQALVLAVGNGLGDPEAPAGAIAEHALRHFQQTVVLVRHKLDQPEEQAQRLWERRRDRATTFETWFAENTFSAEEFEDLERLVTLKQRQQITISLALPTRNEEQTIGQIISTMRAALVDAFPLLDEVVLIDSDSSDRTVEIARELGVPVHVHPAILPQYGSFSGKGEALWKSLYVTHGDIVVWIDTDIKNIDPRFVFGLIGPLLRNPELRYCKGFYRRPLLDQGQLKATGGGRVTELMARPLLNLFYPELSGFAQPLAGEYAGRRSALEKVPFFTGYGVEVGLLIDLLERYGRSALAQVDLMERIHRNQELPALSQMAFAILQVVLQRDRVLLVNAVDQSLKLIHYADQEHFELDVRTIRDHERPPMASIPEYRALHPRLLTQEDRAIETPSPLSPGAVSPNWELADSSNASLG